MLLADVTSAAASDNTPLVLSAAAFVISLLIAILGFVAQYAIRGREKSTDEKLTLFGKENAELRGDMKVFANETRSEYKGINERLQAEEVATAEQNGEIARLRDKHDVIIEDIREIKHHMVRHDQIVQFQRDMDRRFDDLVGKGTAQRSYTRPTPGEYRAAPRPAEETSPPPRDRDRNR